ncbi:MAG: type II toxin-antitoxin system Phd/YefM family antitoxin [Verrucomicrobia bacterium]|nr:type II toxin-antitoxin system Phd/YefM family antitoxin [Verrucomicrobiota bacterium]
MKNTVTTTEAQANLPRLLRQLPAKKSLTITSHGRIAGFLVSKDRMEAIIETMEILANPEAMKAIQAFEAGHSRGKNISCLDD